MGVERAWRKDPAKAAALENWLTKLETTYGDRVVPVDGAVADVRRAGVRLLNPFEDSNEPD